jgi:hypothetical protein
VIDQLLLGFEPFRPADAAYVIESTSAEVILERLECHSLPILPATGTVNRLHAGKIDILQNVIQSIGRSRIPPYYGSGIKSPSAAFPQSQGPCPAGRA